MPVLLWYASKLRYPLVAQEKEAPLLFGQSCVAINEYTRITVPVSCVRSTATSKAFSELEESTAVPCITTVPKGTLLLYPGIS